MRSPLILSLLFLAASIMVTGCRTIDGVQTNSKPFTHEQWTVLLQKNVNDAGWVNYEGFINDSTALNKYLNQIEQNYPNEKTWSREEIIAYWINAYNAFTVQLIIRHYPVAGIKEIKPGLAFVNSVWDMQFINIQGEVLDLNNIEHNILRKMNEPCIHFAVNCASVSCPKLLNAAYEASSLDEQLTQQARDFINDPTRNMINPDKAQLSSIFNWFTGDFTKNGSLKDFVNQFSNTKLTDVTVIDFIEYNWNLNNQ